MALWLIDSCPADLEPELVVSFDDEPECEMTGGFRCSADAEDGPVLQVDPAAVCRAFGGFAEMSPREKCLCVMGRVFGVIQQLQVHTVLLVFDELADCLNLRCDLRTQLDMIREFRKHQESFVILDLYLLAEREFMMDICLEDVRKSLDICCFDWREEEQEPLPLDEDDDGPAACSPRCAAEAQDPLPDGDELSQDKPDKWKTDVSFGIELDRLILQKHMLPGEFIRRANISRQTLNNLRKPDYIPQKYTALACVVALRLGISEANRLLGYAGYTLSPSLKADVIITFYLSMGIFDIDRINAELFHANQHQLGSRS